MKVSNPNTPNMKNLDTVQTSKTDTLKRTPDKNPGASKAVDGAAIKDSSQVNVSTRAQALQKAKEIASNQSVDEAKVARLQKLIDEGKYKVDAQSVADKMVDAHMAFPD